MNTEELIEDFKATVQDHLRRLGADNDSDYHVGKICAKFRKAIPLISAEARKQERERILNWGIETCFEHPRGGVFTRRECPKCWQVLLKMGMEAE